jgi:hypothetical protein
MIIIIIITGYSVVVCRFVAVFIKAVAVFIKVVAVFVKVIAVAYLLLLLFHRSGFGVELAVFLTKTASGKQK